MATPTSVTRVEMRSRAGTRGEDLSGAKPVALDVNASIEDTLSLNAGVEQLYEVLAQQMPPVPAINVEFENLSYSVKVPKHANDISTVGSMLKRMLTGGLGSGHSQEVPILNNVSGTLRPGTTTLLLAPSGHGKSTLLKALAGRIHSSKLCGNIWYGGELIDGVNTNRLATYVGQIDVHLPLLSVRETFQFAKDTWNGTEPPGYNSVMDAAHQRKVNNVLKLLGLEHCADTPVGNNLIRGVSGGEKKRVTFGEMLMANFRVMLMDEISTGLDAAATVDIVRNITLAARYFRSTYVVSLLQPAPEVVELFDDVMLMREGQIVYHGPQAEMVPYFEEMGLTFFNDQAVADFLSEFLADPLAVYARQVTRLREEGLPIPNHVPPTNTEDLVLYFKARQRRSEWIIATGEDSETNSPDVELEPSPGPHDATSNGTHHSEGKTAAVPSSDVASHHVRFDAATTDPVPGGRSASRSFSGVVNDREYRLRLQSPYASAMYAKGVLYAASSWLSMAWMLLARQWKVQMRNAAFVGPRIGQAVFMGLLLGAIFYQLSVDDFQLRVGLIFFACIILAFSNISELPFAAESKYVVYKQTDARFYNAASHVFGVVLTHLPVATMEAAIFGSIMYWMCGFASEASRFLTFLLLVWLLSLVASNLFRVFAFMAPNEDTAQTMVGPTVGMSLIFAGFMVTRDKMPAVLVWLYWVSPFSWLIRALLINEFNSADYDAIPAGATKRLGDLVLDTFEVDNDTMWIAGCIIYFVALYVLFGVMSVMALTHVRREPHSGSARKNEADDIAPIKRAIISQRAKTKLMMTPKSATLSMPFEPMSVVFKNLHYSVQVKVDGATIDRELLAGVSGCATPGTMTALMGASGAGKSTLMDVICGRKTGGKLTGDILVNGHPKHQQAFARVMGYVEQTDLLTTFATVRETLQFSAALRLSAEVPEATRLQFVEDVLELLELDHIADNMVGDETTATNLSPGQRKRLNIGVELVANPTVLFLDEPTSGLDSRAAMSVMRAIKRVALTGRTVVATIHQPSAEIFYKFDSLLLLQKGGHTAYFGSVRNRGRDMVQYLESIPGTPKLPPRTNPADWMLAVIGSGVALDRRVDARVFTESWHRSGIKVKASRLIEGAGTPRPGSKPLAFKRTYERSLCQQLPVVIKRQMQAAWRNVGLNFTRLLLLSFLGLMFGLLFFDMDTSDVAGVNSMNGFLFVGPTFCAVLFMLTSVPFIARERAVFYRERASNTYSSFAYSTALLVAEIPFCIVYTIIHASITYWMVGPKDDLGVFLHYTLVAVILSINFSSIGQLLVAVVPNKDIAQMLTGTVISLCNLLGGFFLPLPSMAAGVKWLFWINPSSYSYHVAAAIVFHCEGADCPTVQTVSSQGVAVQTVSDFMEQQLGYVYDDRWLMTIGAACFIVGTHFLMALALRYISHLKR